MLSFQHSREPGKLPLSQLDIQKDTIPGAEISPLAETQHCTKGLAKCPSNGNADRNEASSVKLQATINVRLSSS